MTVARASRHGERPTVAAILLAATLLSLLLGFRVGMIRQDLVGFGLQFPAPGLDLSYTYAMNRASADGRVFGREFVSTYGPFGYAIAAMDVGGTLVPWILSQLLLTLGLGSAAGAYAWSARPARWSAVAWTFLVLTTIHVLADEYRWLCLVTILLLLGLKAAGRGAPGAFAAAGLLGGLGLLVKLSLGFGALLSVGAAAVLSRRVGPAMVRLAAALGAAMVGLTGGLWLYQGSTTGLRGYLATAAAVTGGYSSAMSLAPAGGWRVAGAFGVFVALLVVAAVLGSPRLRVTLAALGLPLFVAWKHALVRQDGHVQLFVTFAFAAVALLLVGAAEPRDLRRLGPPLFLGVAALVWAWLDSPDSGPRPALLLGRTLAQPLGLPGLRSVLVLSDLPGHRAALARASADALASLRLPEAERRRMGTEAVDVYPWESSYVAANGLNWRSRPSPASFATYSPALDARNASFFAAPSRPPFVLWHKGAGVRSIDRRHLFWDEPLTLLTLLDGYDAVWRGDVLLLASRREPRFAPPQPVMATTAPWDEWLTLPRVEEALLAAVEIDVPLASRVRRLALREDPAFLAVRFEDGERARFRYVPDQARSGLFLDPLPRSADDVVALFSGQCPEARVEAIRFIGGFRPGAPPPRITFWRLRGPRGPAFGCRR